MNPKKKLVIAVGGTGGHVIPAMHLGDQFANDDQIAVSYMGVGLAKNRFFEKEGRVFFEIEGGNFSKGVFYGLKNICKGVYAAIRWLKKENIDRVVGFGSYHSLPVVLAAKVLKIPYDIVELNRFPGKINRFFSRWAQSTFIHFKPYQQKWIFRPTYIEYSFKKQEKKTKEEALAAFGFRNQRNTLLIFGGSQGAQMICDAWLKTAPCLEFLFQVIHITQDKEKALACYKKHNIEAFVTNFIKEMDLAYLASDLAICRAGAGAIREMLIFECPAILVPYTKASEDHQRHNARFMQNEIGGAIFLEENKLSSQLELTVREIFAEDGKKHQAMQKCLQNEKTSKKREALVDCIRRRL